jgi:spore germination cell wall hydrolase CwlJ-like protein
MNSDESAPLEPEAADPIFWSLSRPLSAVAVAIVALSCLGFALWSVAPSQHMARVGRAAAAASILPSLPKNERRPVDPLAAENLNAVIPFAPLPAEATPPFIFVGSDDARARAIDCLAAAGWYEVGDDPEGQRAVFQVVLNRTRHVMFPKTICATVFQGSDLQTGCQFTFTCDGALRRRPDARRWQEARYRAEAAIGGDVYPPVRNATHYHANYVLPYWAEQLDKIAQVDVHLFYKWRGGLGTRAAFRVLDDMNEPVIALLRDISVAHQPVTASIAFDNVAINSMIASEHVVSLPAPVPAPAGLLRRPPPGRITWQGDNMTVMQLDPQMFAGRYAIHALAICKDLPQCWVMGWRSGAAPAHSQIDDAQLMTLSFLYVRTEEGADRSYWNCTESVRSDPARCLPASVKAIRSLITRP